MKNAKKISVAVVLVAAILALAVFTAVASNEYTGNVQKLTSLVDKAVMEGDLAAKETKLDEVIKYLTDSPVNPEEEGYSDIIALFESTVLEVANACLAEAEKPETSAANKDAYLTKAAKWIDIVYDTDEERATDEYTSFMARIYAMNLVNAKELHKTFEAKFEGINSTDTAVYFEAVAALKALHSFTKTHIFDMENAEAAAIVADSNAAYATYQQILESRKADLLAQAKLSEYGLGVAYETYFNNGNITPAVSNNKDGFDASGNVAVNRVLRETEITGYDESGNAIVNTYYTLHYDGIKNSAGSYLQPYFNPTYSGASSGIVIEFDITAFDALPSNGIGFQPFAGSSWMNISSTGTLTGYGANTSASTDDVIISNAIVVGEWTHITYIYNHMQKDRGMLFVDYVFAGYVHGDNGNKGTTPPALRIGNTKSYYGSISIDNLVFTLGTAPRDEKYFVNMTDDSKFVYYVDYMQNTDGQKLLIGVPDCILAYEYATDLVTKYIDFDENGDVVRDENGAIRYKGFSANLTAEDIQAVKDAIDAYLVFDPSDIIDKYNRENLAKLDTMTDKLQTIIDTMAPTSAKITSITNQLNLIDTFLVSYGTYVHDDTNKNDYALENPPTDRLLYDGTVYQTCQDIITAGTERLNNDTKVYKYILAMNSFESSMSISTLEKKFAEAEAILAEGIPIDDYYDDEGNPLLGYEDFDKHYYITRAGAAAKIILAKQQTNSRAVINQINYLCDKYPNESDWKLVFVAGDNLSKEQQAINETYTYIANYLATIRSYLVPGEYDPDYINGEGDSLEYAIERYSAMNEYYYSILQAEYSNTLLAYLDQCSASNSYIEKKGLLAHIRRYIASNEFDITYSYTCDTCGAGATKNMNILTPICPICSEDVTITHMSTEREGLSLMIQRYLAYVGELELQAESYEDLLSQNTSYFIDIVQMFSTAITYSEKKALYDLATTYYDVMNVGGADAQAAIAIYDDMTADLLVFENASREFIRYTGLLATTDDEDVYFLYLVSAARAQKNYDTSIEGVSEALVIYNAARNAYDTSVDNANSEISMSGHSLGSLTSNCGLSSVVSVIIERLFSFAK